MPVIRFPDSSVVTVLASVPELVVVAPWLVPVDAEVPDAIAVDAVVYAPVIRFPESEADVWRLVVPDAVTVALWLTVVELETSLALLVDVAL